MAKTVDSFSTLEDFRLRYNELAADVGDISGIVTARKQSIVEAINSIEEKVFYFQEYVFTSGASQSSFTGLDDSGASLRFRKNRIQVFVDELHLVEEVDYIVASAVGNGFTEIQLIGAYSAGLNAGQKLTLYSFTGSFIGTEIAEAVAGYYTENSFNAIYNTNDEGVILNGRSFGATTVLTYGDVVDGEYKLELAGNVYTQGNQLVDGESYLASASVADLTDNRIVISGASGSLEDDANLTFDGTTFNVGAGNFQVTASSGDTILGDINSNGGNFTVDSLGNVGAAGTVTSTFSGNLTGNVTGQVSDISNHSTTNLSEGTRLYHTTERAQDAAATMITSATHTNITVTYDDNANTLAFTAAEQYGDSDVESYLSGGAGITYGSGTIALDYEVVSSAPTGVGSTSVGHLWFVV